MTHHYVVKVLLLLCLYFRRNISSICSKYSEANASEFLENLKEMFRRQLTSYMKKSKKDANAENIAKQIIECLWSNIQCSTVDLLAILATHVQHCFYNTNDDSTHTTGLCFMHYTL